MLTFFKSQIANNLDFYLRMKGSKKRPNEKDLSRTMSTLSSKCWWWKVEKLKVCSPEGHPNSWSSCEIHTAVGGGGREARSGKENGVTGSQIVWLFVWLFTFSAFSLLESRNLFFHKFQWSRQLEHRVRIEEEAKTCEVWERWRVSHEPGGLHDLLPRAEYLPPHPRSGHWCAIQILFFTLATFYLTRWDGGNWERHRLDNGRLEIWHGQGKECKTKRGEIMDRWSMERIKWFGQP